MAGRPSKMDQLPPELREGIEALWTSQRYTLDQLQGFLADLTSGKRSMLPPELAAAPAVAPSALPGRSGLHAHLQGVDRVAERLNRVRAASEALMRKLEDAPEDRVARLNNALVQGAIFDMFTADDRGDGEQTVTIDAETVPAFAKALKDLASAKKLDAETTLRLRREAAADAAKAAERVAKSKGLTADTVDLIKREILGIAK